MSKHSTGQKKLVLSPDTDIYHIGLPLVANTELEVLIKISPLNSREFRLLDIQALVEALIYDPDLAKLPTLSIPLIIQVMFICTGCDYTSFFHGFEKASFLHTLYQYAECITSGNMDTPGSLSDIDEHGIEDGFLSFLRLIGCAYFQKHKSTFQPAYMSPLTHFNSFTKEGLSPSVLLTITANG